MSEPLELNLKNTKSQKKPYMFFWLFVERQVSLILNYRLQLHREIFDEAQIYLFKLKFYYYTAACCCRRQWITVILFEKTWSFVIS